MRQLLTENLALAGLGGIAGLVVAAWTSRFLAGFHQAFRLPLDVDAGFDFRVLAFAAVVSVLAGIVLALIPARAASRCELATALKADTGTAGLRRLRTTQILVIAQVSLSTVLLLGAGLFVSTLQNARSVDISVHPENVLLSSLDLASRDYDEARGSVLYARILESIRGLPGVRDAALVFVVPLGGRRGGTNVEVRPPGGGAPMPAQVGFNVVTPGYFRTIGIPVVRGRDLNDADRRGSAAVAVINDEMARSLFAGSEPIGREFLLKWPPAGMVEVVGVVRDGRFRSYRTEPEPTVYVPLAQRYMPAMSLEVRTTGNPASLVGAIRTAVAALDKDLPLADFKTLKAHFEDALSQERLIASLLSGFGVLALGLAAIGIYGVLSNSVAQRTREIGVRLALGADRRAVQLSVVVNAMRPVGLGLAIGVATALVLTRLVKNLLFGLSPTDPYVIGGSAATLLLVALLASYMPARRAARVDPVTALRHE
jgi:predicted permease